MGFAALHHPLQHRPFAEILQLFEVPLEFAEAPCVAFQDGTLCSAPDPARGSWGMWHYAYGDNTVRYDNRKLHCLRPHRGGSRIRFAPVLVGIQQRPPTPPPPDRVSATGQKAWRCSDCSSRLTCNIAATEMWDSRCACNSRTARCSTPTAGLAPALAWPAWPGRFFTTGST